MLKGQRYVKPWESFCQRVLVQVEKRMGLSHHILLLDTIFFLPPALAFVFTIAIGAVIGSFLNVVIHRLPREESIVFPNSRCPHCEAAIKPYDNIPVISYLILRGRCRSCRAPISMRYPAVEALTALLYGLVFWHDGLTPALCFDLPFVTALVALIFIDAEHMLLPNLITYPGLVFALVARLALPFLMGDAAFEDLRMLARLDAFAGWPIWAVSLAGAGLGALLGGGSLWLIGWLWERLRGVEAMGLGDVKMMFMVGAYLGWRLTILNIFIAVFLGSFVGLGAVLWQTYREVGSASKLFKLVQRRELDLQIPLPFGIFLGIAAILSLIFGGGIVSWYAGQYGF
jgi:leader peptidase (prepilin peptidase)/N-methyltransferase